MLMVNGVVEEVFRYSGMKEEGLCLGDVSVGLGGGKGEECEGVRGVRGRIKWVWCGEGIEGDGCIV